MPTRRRVWGEWRAISVLLSVHSSLVPCGFLERRRRAQATGFPGWLVAVMSRVGGASVAVVGQPGYQVALALAVGWFGAPGMKFFRVIACCRACCASVVGSGCGRSWRFVCVDRLRGCRWRWAGGCGVVGAAGPRGCRSRGVRRGSWGGPVRRVAKYRRAFGPGCLDRRVVAFGARGGEYRRRILRAGGVLGGALLGLGMSRFACAFQRGNRAVQRCA